MATSDLLIRLRADVGQAERALGGIAGTLGKLSSGRGFQLGALGGGLGITGVMAKAISTSEQFNASFADVQRTVNGLDASGFRQLKTDLIDLSKTPGMPAAKDLAQIAAAGGQMNIPSDRLMDFTRTVAEMSQITGMSVDSTSEALGKLSNVTGETDLHRLGSEITAVGNVNVGGIPQLLDVSQRLALVGHQMGLGVPQILAIGGAIGDAGIEAEMGGSAVSRIFLEMQQAVSTASSSIVTNTKDVRDAMQRVGDIGDDIGLAEQQRSEMFTKRGRLKKGVTKSSLMAADLRISRLKREQGDASSDLFDLQHPGQNKLAAFAEMAGMSSDQFGAEFKMSPFNAFGDVLRGLHGMSSDQQQGLLTKAGINNIRDIETLAGLSGTAGHMGDLFSAGQAQASNPTALDDNFGIKASTDLAQQQAILHELEAGLIQMGDNLAPEMIAAEQSALGLATHLKDSSDVFNGIVGNLDKILPALAGLSILNSVGGFGLLGGLLKAGGGAAGSVGGVAAGAATGVGGTFGGGLAAIIAGTLGVGFAADKVADMAKAQGAPDAVVEALRNFGPPGAAAGAQGIKQIIVDVGGIQTGGGLSWDDVKAGLEAAWNRAVAVEPVTRQLGGAYTP